MEMDKIKNIIKSQDLHNKLVIKFESDLAVNNSTYCILINIKEIILNELEIKNENKEN